MESHWMILYLINSQAFLMFWKEIWLDKPERTRKERSGTGTSSADEIFQRKTTTNIGILVRRRRTIAANRRRWYLLLREINHWTNRPTPNRQPVRFIYVLSRSENLASSFLLFRNRKRKRSATFTRAIKFQFHLTFNRQIVYDFLSVRFVLRIGGSRFSFIFGFILIVQCPVREENNIIRINLALEKVSYFILAHYKLSMLIFFISKRICVLENQKFANFSRFSAEW